MSIEFKRRSYREIKDKIISGLPPMLQDRASFPGDDINSFVSAVAEYAFEENTNLANFIESYNSDKNKRCEHDVFQGKDGECFQCHPFKSGAV